MGANVAITSFAGGEIGKEALARVDLDIYQTTGETFQNCWATMRGSLTRVPGTEYIGAVSDVRTKLRPFAYNVDQTRVLEIADYTMKFVDDNDYVALTGGTATVANPADNTSTGGSSISGTSTLTFTCVAGGQAKAYWQITGGQVGVQTTFSFEVQRRPVKFSVGTTTGLEDILSEITLEPGYHIITISPTATTYYLRMRLDEAGKALCIGMARVAAGVMSLTTPWAISDLESLRMRQSNDVVYMYHPDYRTRVLERRGDTSWSLRLFRPEDGPFEVQNLTTTTLTPSATTGSVNITASKAIFSSSSVGQLLELTHQGQTETLAATAVDQVTDAIRVIGLDSNRQFTLQVAGTFVGTVKLQRSFGNTVDWIDYTSYTAPTTVIIDDDLDNQIVYYRVKCSAYTSGTINVTLTYGNGETTGRCEIVAYTSATVVVAEVYEEFGSTTATTRWSEGSWSTVNGWPVAGLIEDARHWIVNEDNRLFVSASDDYESFLIDSDVSAGISRTVGVGETNVPRWIEIASRIVVGTHGGELEVGSNNLDETITYLNLKAKVVGDEGSANTQAQRAGKRVAFIDMSRTRLLQAYQDSDTGSTEIDDLCRLHEKIAGDNIEQGSGDGFVEIAYQKRPEKRIWVVRSDGQMCVMLYVPKEGVYAWSRIVGAESASGDNGLFRSVCVIPGAPEDRVHVIVERVINGSTVYYHERFALNRFPIETDADGNKSAPEAWRLQCALATDGAATTAFSGLTHLNGETVRIWADGKDVGTKVVSGGAITLDDAAEYVIIGLEVPGYWKSSKMSYGARRGTGLTMEKQVGRLGIVTHETPIGAVLWGRSFDLSTDTVLNEFYDDIPMDQPAFLVESEENQPFEGELQVDPRIHLVMTGAAPVTVLAIVPNVELEEQ